MAKKVVILIGSESDRDIADKAALILDEADISNEVIVASAHRNPDKVKEVVENTDAEVFICIAGLAAALPGFVASLTKKPVIGVPKDVAVGGLDALLSIVQMPPGVPVATVGINNGKNAGHLAVRILNLKYGSQEEGAVSAAETSGEPSLNPAPETTLSAPAPVAEPSPAPAAQSAAPAPAQSGTTTPQSRKVNLSTALPFGGQNLPNQTQYVPSEGSQGQTEGQPSGSVQENKKDAKKDGDWWPEGVKKV